MKSRWEIESIVRSGENYSVGFIEIQLGPTELHTPIPHLVQPKWWPSPIRMEVLYYWR